MTSPSAAIAAIPPESPAGDAGVDIIPPAGARQWWMAIVLSLAMMASLADRNGIVLLVAPIRAAFDISDVQMSLLLGFAFIAPYSLLAIPAGYLVDRVNRRALLASAIVVWASMSAFCGFAGSFGQLFFGRGGVGLAEAVLAPTGNSMIRDGFPTRTRARAFGIFIMGAVVGTGLGTYAIGSLIVASDHGFFHAWPVLGHLQTWQIVLAVPGLCTLPIAFLMMTTPEPPRSTSALLKTERPRWPDTIRYLREYSWVFVPYLLAVTLNGWGREGYNAWEPTALIRGWGLQAATIAHVTGMLSIVVGTAGVFTTAWVIERWIQRGVANAPLRVMIIGQTVFLICNLIILHAPQGHPGFIFFFIGVKIFFLIGPSSVGTAMTLASITPSRLMGQLTALVFLCGSLLATTGPTAVALVSKYAFSGDRSIISAMQLVYVPGQIAATSLFILAALRVQRFHRIHAGGLG